MIPLPRPPIKDAPAYDGPPLPGHVQLSDDPAAVVAGLEYALAAILDTHTRILAAHPPSPKRQAKRAAWRKNAAAFAARHRAERRGK